MADKKRKVKRWQSRQAVQKRRDTSNKELVRKEKSAQKQRSELSEKYSDYRKQKPEAKPYGNRSAPQREGTATVRNQAQRDMAKKRSKRRKQKNNITTIAFIIAAVAVVGVAASLIFFKIESIEVTGNQRYNADQIVLASGIELGDRLFSFGEGAARNDLCINAPYVTAVKFKHKLPGTLIIEVTEIKARMAFEDGSNLILADKNFKALEKVEKLPERTALIKGLKLKKKDIGYIVECDNEEKQSTLAEIVRVLELNKLENITEIDITNSVNCRFTYDNRIICELGQPTDLEYKIEMARKSLVSLNKSDPHVLGTLNLKQATTTKEAYFSAE